MVVYQEAAYIEISAGFSKVDVKIIIHGSLFPLRRILDLCP